MFGRNHHHRKTYQPWGNGSGRSVDQTADHRKHQHQPATTTTSSSQIQRDTHELDQYRRQLEREIEALKAKKRDLESRFPDPECEKIFREWGGSEIIDSTETFFCINFHPHFRGKVQGTYTLALHKLGAVWSLAHHSLPFSITDIAQKISKLQIKTIDQLSVFIRCLQQEINLFVWRREQFNEAKELATPSFGVYPSISTTEVQLTFSVSDSVGSNLSHAFVSLIYRSHKFLPEEPAFSFRGGDTAARQKFKEQLSILECMPLKEAILTAFPRTDTITMDSNTSFLSEPCTQMLTGGKAKSNIPEPTTRASASPEKKRRATSESEQTDEDLNTATPSPPPANDQNRVERGRGRGGARARRGAVRGRGRGRPRVRRN